jgi:CIC family chloride channel protein
VGGVFAPSLFAGLMFGGAFGRIVAVFGSRNIISDPQAYAIVGMAAMMAGVVHAPITAIMLVFELSNDYRLILPIMLAAVVCVYVAERIVPQGIYGLGLARKGVHLQQGRDIDVMQGVTVGEAMITPPPTIGETVSLTELRDALRRHHTRSLSVVDEHGALTGIVTLTDLQSAFENRTPEISTLTVADICSRSVITVNPDDVLWTAIRAMGARDVGRLPVIKRGSRELVGVLSRSNIVDAYSTAIARKLHDQRHAEQIRLSALTGTHVFEFKISPGAPIAGKSVSDVRWPDESVIASIQRKHKLLIPHGSTKLQPDDVLTVVAAAELEGELKSLFDTHA